MTEQTPRRPPDEALAAAADALCRVLEELHPGRRFAPSDGPRTEETRQLWEAVFRPIPPDEQHSQASQHHQDS